MKEIGGYLEFESFHGNSYHENCLSLNTARNCLRYIIRKRKIQKIFLPKLNCISVIEACNKENVQIETYNIDMSFYPILTNITSNDWVYIINFYGQLDNNDIRQLHMHLPNLIVDNVPAFFNYPVSDIDTIYSCRKFFGVPDGAYLYMNDEFDLDIPQDTSSRRIGYLVGRMEDGATLHYNEYHINEEYLDNQDIKNMSVFTNNMMHGIDYNLCLNQRRKNFEILYEAFECINQLKLKMPFGPFAYPLMLANGAEIRKKLQQKKIFIPTLWPNVLKSLKSNDLEYKMAENILPIPVDQRYNPLDMKYLVNEIFDIQKER